MKRIVIVGGGFVGLLATRRLQRRLRGKAQITLVDRNERFVFSPWLIDGLAGQKDAPDYSANYTELAAKEGWLFERGDAQTIDRNAKVLDIKTHDGTSKALPYEFLVVCPGSSVAYYGIPGADTNAFPLKTLEDVQRVHAKLAELVKQARVADEVTAKHLLRFVIVGGGPSGIEALFALKRYLRHELLCDAPQLTNKLAFTLVDGGKNILNGFKETIVAGARKALERQGVEIVNGDPAASVEAGGLTLKSGKKLDSGLVLWCAGVSPNALDAKPELPRQSDSFLHLEHAVFGAGDAILFLDAQGKPASRTAQTAMQQARVLADNVLAGMAGKEPKPYKHHVRGFILTFGDTGYLDTPIGGHMFPTVVPFREIFYRFRFWQMTGR